MMVSPSRSEQSAKKASATRSQKGRNNSTASDTKPPSETSLTKKSTKAAAKKEEEEEKTRSPSTSARKTKSSNSKSGPKKVEIFLPGPSPKPETPSSGKKPTSKAKARSHERVPSASTNTDSISVTASAKPVSNVGSATNRGTSPDSTADDQSVVSEAHKGSAPRARKSEAERIQFFEEDPLCGSIETHRVFCTKCNQWIDSQSRRKYVMKAWVAHRKDCGNANESPKNGDHDEAAEDDGDETDGQSSVAASPSSVREGTRVATAKRKLILVNDPQVKSFTPSQVQCASCKKTILLGELEYGLTNWEQHKTTCVTPSPVRRTRNKAKSKTATSPQTRSGVASDNAAVVSKTSPPSASRKRAREEEAEGADDRAPVRARTEAYIPPEGNATGLIGWFLSPIKTFIRGFREGLSSSS